MNYKNLPSRVYELEVHIEVIPRVMTELNVKIPMFSFLGASPKLTFSNFKILFRSKLTEVILR